MNYYQHHIGDFNNATRHLTRVERALYRDLIELYYDKEQPLISDEKKLARLMIAVTDEEKKALNTVLEEFFTIENGEYHNSRCNEEIDKYHSRADSARANGKLGGRPRKPTKTQPVNLANPEITGSKANQEPVTKNQLKESKPKKTATRFSTPSESDIQKYESEKGLNLTGFHDYYESNGWRVGRNPMKDWRASARGWSKRQVTNRQSNETNQRTPKNKTEQFYETLQAIHERSVDN